MMSDLTLRVNIGQKSGLGASQSLIYSQLIKEEEISQLARARDISVSQKQIDDEYAALAIKDSLGLSGGEIKNQIIKPVLLLKELRLWFNSQRNLNEQTYKLADSLLDRINKDSGLMPELAGQFSEDKTGKSVKGDMGFVQITDLSPELRESASSMKTGETKIVPGILGLYLFRLEEQHGNQVHLRTIFLNTSDFDAWFNGEFKKFNVINLVKQ